MRIQPRKLVGYTIAVLLLLTAVGCGTRTSNNPESSQPVPSVSPASSEPFQWSTSPEMTIDKTKSYEAVFETNKGTFTVELFAKDAPITVNNFVFLAEQHYFDGVTFHRIIESFMIQTGDRTGTGSGGPGYSIPDELNNGHTYETGIVAMANAGPGTGGSQFFICTGDDSQGLNDSRYAKYSIFGKVSSGMDVVKKIAATPVALNSNGTEVSVPAEKVTIDKLVIKTHD
ncbi:peptidylprolyl isomerase [Gorillibacterium timonense]|uniref:peptidylprolyl isomerase n=1 Tax=Gorillibacterium timonense TaxID=1689269 RepID=UPI00071C242F|nr:peptidylprolyl isomerase [Gorillibacterium timonense]